MTLVSATCCVYSKAATSVTVPAITTSRPTLFVSSLKPPPTYDRVELRVGSSCSSSHHVSHRKLRSPALLGDRENNHCGSGTV